MGRSVSFAPGSAWVKYGHLLHEDFCEDFVDEVRETLRGAFPSLEEEDRWLDREDHALLANRLVYVGVSEYCGMVSLWCVPVEDSPLAERWARSIEAKVQALWDDMATVRSLNLMGRFSNGEALFQARA